jgi:ubiquinone/menaquinone biosynthesis C-methylase UbiE
MEQQFRPAGALPPEAQAHYATAVELHRLSQGTGQLEFVRSQDILSRYLPSPPAIIFDVGGGPGRYAYWLAGQGYRVHLIDGVPLHIEQAQQLAANESLPLLASLSVGDARQLDVAEASGDAVLLMGPLYHLTARQERLAALREARRIVKPEGLVVASGISRFTSVLDGLVSGYLNDPEFVRIVQQDLVDGQHRNPRNHPAYFTTTFFHAPAELQREMEESGLRHEATLAVEGPAWLFGNFAEQWHDPRRRERLLTALRGLEGEPSLLGASAHLMAIGRKVLGAHAPE